MVTSISEDISGQTHHHAGSGAARPKLSYLRSLSQKPRPPPSVVITDDSDAYPGNGGVNPSVFDALFARPFGSPSNNRGSGGEAPGSPGNSAIVAAVSSSASAAAGLHQQHHQQLESSSPCGKANGVCSGSPLRHLGRSFSRDSSALHGGGSFTTDGSFDASDNTCDAEASAPGHRTHRRRCCSEPHRRVVQGIFLTLIVAGSWVGSAHLLKRTYMAKGYHLEALARVNGSHQRLSESGQTHQSSVINYPGQAPPVTAAPDPTANEKFGGESKNGYNAPFFTTWFCTLWNSFFFPVYLVTSCCGRHDKSSSKKLFVESIQQFQEKGFTVLQFFGRCGFFSILWVATNYMFVHSLRLLHTTFVVALYCSNVSFVYLLSWVVLHDQFVGIRIVAVILCNTGIALLAYMDGVSRASTLGGVVLAAAAAAGSAVYKVFFKKLVGEVSFGQLSLFFTLVGILNILLLWPIVLTLYFSNAEVIVWNHMPWASLGGAAALSLVANLLGNFGVIWTYEIFLTLGLVFAVPASAVIDVYMYGVRFEGMKLSGIILIAVGFFLVMFPQDWPDYLTLLLRWRRKQQTAHQEALSAHRSRLRTPSGQVK